MYSRLRQTLAPALGLIALAALIALGVTNIVNAQLSGSSLTSYIASYHANANEIVNRRLQGAVTQLQLLRDKPEANRISVMKQFIQPSGDLIAETCASEDRQPSQMNFSTTCLHYELQILRNLFLNDLDNKSLNIPLGNASEISDLNRLEEQVRAYQRNKSLELMASVVNSYNQLITNATMHYENEITIAEINTLQDHLYDLELTIGLLPGEFHNVTTNRCQ